jgi:chromosome segregation ATPase
MTNPANGLIKTEMDRLKSRKTNLEAGLVEHQKAIHLQQQAMQSAKDEIQTIDLTLDELHAASKKLDGKITCSG